MEHGWLALSHEDKQKSYMRERDEDCVGRIEDDNQTKARQACTYLVIGQIKDKQDTR
jgi:hypothetical protein